MAVSQTSFLTGKQNEFCYKHAATHTQKTMSRSSESNPVTAGMFMISSHFRVRLHKSVLTVPYCYNNVLPVGILVLGGKQPCPGAYNLGLLRQTVAVDGR